MEAVVITVVDVTNFLTASNASHEALKTANLLKGLSVNAMIMGERGTGKLTLARTILPSAPVIDGQHFDELLNALEKYDTIIIHRLDDIANLKRFEETLNRTKTRVIATGGFRYTSEQLENIFSIRFLIPPLRERLEDIALLSELFVQEAAITFGKIEFKNIENIRHDVSENAISLRRQIYLHCLLSGIEENNLMDVMENFLFSRMGSNNDYRKFLHLFEVPLIRAGIKKFKSQLQLADRLGLNRNTLRKKISDHAEYNLELKE
ncbi:MAG: helix-turn-helix domain-containing protein [Sulfuricurvum sp.]|uniref:helix-turn-helix domain-containing protein n=1 Tax=Sulfuricurvum sp. TaxID=2025608 RepID=UPI00262A79C9|nr:helix-turn-helix domain-containing protein [Sulfuricurvum sp.]MDD2829308.1 helix-turn-helix domain-containing protein [Sulfuricurvum sp.]MDD4948625.1 helix-turn-helix domain-containing protein [Sulfuricurvum sp.]